MAFYIRYSSTEEREQPARLSFSWRWLNRSKCGAILVFLSIGSFNFMEKRDNVQIRIYILVEWVFEDRREEWEGKGRE